MLSVLLLTAFSVCSTSMRCTSSEGMENCPICLPYLPQIYEQEVMKLDFSSGTRVDKLVNGHRDLMTVTVSPKAWSLLKKHAGLIEDAVRSTPLPDISEKDGAWKVYADELHFKKLSLINDVSFQDGNGLRLYMGGIVYNLGARIKVKHTLGQATQRFEFYSYNANLLSALMWNDFTIVPSTNVNLNLKIDWPKAWYYRMLPSSLKNKIRNMICNIGENVIRNQVNQIMSKKLNPVLQELKQRMKNITFFNVINFDQEIAVQWNVQKQYLSAALTPKSVKPIFTPVVPFDEMICIDVDLLEVLMAALSPREIFSTNKLQSATKLDFKCVAPRFMCDGLHCQFCSDVETISAETNTTDIYHNCLSFD